LSRRLLPALILALTACVNDPVTPHLEEYNLSAFTARGAPFLHLLVGNGNDSDSLHVYIEGDGKPWQTPRTISLDPTPGKAVMLDLMVLDTSAAIYLGRPCYFNLGDAACSPIWWTDKRYSEQVVTSMARALDDVVVGHDDLVLIGYSGGGALAMLLAAKRNDVRAVVTLAANLDTRAWALHHGYTPLHGSLNPADLPALPQEIGQFHFAGSEDTVVTVDMIAGALHNQPDATLEILEGADHSCCWVKWWPGILATIDESK
jgi:pimeloyl-ACP methyl ester carboxylesterase